MDPGVDRACDPQDNCDPQENKDRRYADEQRCQRTHGLDRDEAEHRHLEHNVFRRKHIMLLSCYYRMLFCEKPDSTFSQHALERLPICLNQVDRSKLLIYRIFFDQPVSTWSENALGRAGLTVS
ncbi:MAG: hypothetical protein IOC52_12270 [Methylobacterium sp.]|nr:hypothetical protein [Methylobacterium sp.]